MKLDVKVPFLSFAAALYFICTSMLCLAEDDENSNDFITPFAFAEFGSEVFSQQVNNTSINFVLSAIKKVNGRWRYDRVKTLSGHLYSKTFELTRVSSSDAAKKIRSYTSAEHWDLQFQCVGLECGTSYAWADQVFENKLLDGVDTLQYYWVWKVRSGWALAYLVERGNKRVYLQWQFLHESKPITTSDAIAEWQRNGFAEIITAKNDQITPDQLAQILRWIELCQCNRFAVVGHSAILGEMNALQLSSLKDAQKIADQLKQSKSSLNINVYGLGPLAPRVGKGRRVEIVPLLP